MKGIRPIRVVCDGLSNVQLPSLARPRLGPKEPRTEELVQWATKFYAYSIVAHIHKILSGLIVLADSENIPAAYIVSRHIFEWTAQACLVSSKLKDSYRAKDWEEGWIVLTPAAIGNLWARKYGAKYALPSQQPPTAPDPLRVGIAVSAYESYQTQKYGLEEVKDTYSLLSEFSHPNAACLQQYHIIGNGGSLDIKYVEDYDASPLPFVNRCLIDLTQFVDTLLQLSAETTARTGMRQVLTELGKLAPKVRT